MKQFNRMQLQQIIHNHIIPTGAFYGKITLKYSRRIIVDEYQLTDENGQPIFYQDGSPIKGHRYMTENCAQQLYYSLETTKTYKDSNNHNWFTVWIAYDNNDNLPLRWHEETLGGNALTKELQRYLYKCISRYLLRKDMKWSDIVIDRPHVNLIKTIVPKARKAQSEYIY